MASIAMFKEPKRFAAAMKEVFWQKFKEDMDRAERLTRTRARLRKWEQKNK